MDISVIIPNLNADQMLRDCIRAVRENTRASVEIIVVDNGGTPDLPDVTTLRNERNLGFGRAVNKGAAVAKGEFLCILNNDTQVQPGALDTLIEFLRTHPDAGICGPQLVHADGSLQNSFDNFPTLLDQFVNKTLLRLLCPSRFPSKRRQIEQPTPVESIVGACLVISRELFLQLGGFDERYFIYLEETDLCKRSPKKVYLVPQARVGHLSGATKQRAPHRGRIEYTRSLFKYFRRHSSAYWLFRTLYPVKVLVQVVLLFVSNLLTLFLIPRLRRRLRTYAWLLLWLALFCPEGFGFE